MECKFCKEEGKTWTRIERIFGCRTLMHHKPYYDSSGKYHNHDRNKITTTYRCSNDHSFDVRRMKASTCCSEVSDEIISVTLNCPKINLVSHAENSKKEIPSSFVSSLWKGYTENENLKQNLENAN
jgi:hypothetical protein